MPKYLVSLASTSRTDLRWSDWLNLPSSGDAIEVAKFQLYLRRSHEDGGPEWDTWTVAERAYPSFLPKIIASGGSEGY